MRIVNLPGAAAGADRKAVAGPAAEGAAATAVAPRRRFVTLGPKPRLWLNVATVALMLMLTAPVIFSVARGSQQRPKLLIWQATGGGSQQASSEQQQSATVADQQRQQQQSATVPGQQQQQQQQQQQFATVADQQEATWQRLPDGPETEGLPCRESGYCSVGKLRAYVGEVDSFEGFKAALNASCYRKECFHITIGTNGHSLALNFVTRAWQLGLTNIMLHAKDSESCGVLAAAGYNNVTCVWTARDWFGNTPGSKHFLHERTEQWAIRYILFARAVWLGYNVFMIDSDSYMFRDPYAFLTQPPFANISFMSLQDNGPLVNGGTSYIHNAAPGGPAWWTIAAVAERLIFVKENWEGFFQPAFNISNPEFIGHAMMDQPVLSDIIAWQFLGFPTLAFSQVASPLRDAEKVTPLLAYSLIPEVYPPEWKPIAGKSEDVLIGLNLTIPFSNGSWPVFGAGPRWPPRGKYSLAFIKMLEEESGYKFPDALSPRPPGFEMPRNETWTFMPFWLVGAWLMRGVDGYWELTPPPPQVMLHVIYVPGLDWLVKENTLKAHNAWNWDVSLALEGRLFPSSTPEQQLPRVLALPPGMRLEATSAQDYRDKTAQLVKLALRLNRVLLMPEPVCEGDSWIARTEWKDQRPDLVDPATGKVHKKFVTWLERLMSYGLDDDYHCIWWPYLEKPCMRAYLVHHDFRELVRRLPPGTGSPSPDNTVQLEAGATLQAALQAAAQKEAPHILFLSSMPSLAAPLPDGVGEEDKRFLEWSQECHWMHQVPELVRRRRLGERQQWQWQWQREHGPPHNDSWDAG